MEITVTTKKDNKVVGRQEIKAQVAYKGATPSNANLRKELSKQLKVEEILVVVKHVYTIFGEQKADVLAFSYNDKESLKLYEDVKEEPKPEEKKEEAVTEAKEETPKVEEKKEEAVAEVKEEAPKAEEKKEEAVAEVKEEASKAEEKKEEAAAEVKEEASKAEEKSE